MSETYNNQILEKGTLPLVIDDDTLSLHKILTEQSNFDLSLEETYEIGCALIDFFELLATQEPQDE